jgi:hypothetical protein
LRNFNIFVREPQRFGGDLAKDGIRALAEFCARNQHANTAIGMGFDADYGP